MNATNAQDPRSRSTQQGGRSQDHSLHRYRGPVPPHTVIPPRAVNSQRGLDLAVDYPIQMNREVGRPQPREDPVRSVDKVFNVYGERIRADLRDMHGLCTQLVAQEKQEAAKWYALCAKVITERDHARQRLNSLAGSSSGGGHHTDSAGSRHISKRGRDDIHGSSLDNPSTRSNVAVESRSLRPLRLSPVHSPPASPSPGMSMSPPLSATSPFSVATTPPSSSRSEFFQFEQRPAKLRRSCDLSNSISYEIIPKQSGSPPPSQTAAEVRVKQQPRTPSPLTFPTHVGDIFHADLMYVSAKGGFLCRACLLKKSKSPSFEPKGFPLSASWDELRDHCVRLHPEACADVARLQPAEIFELRRRLSPQ